MRRTKIVCTIGPATASRYGILGLINAGMNVARLNFSHGTHEDHGKVIDLVREISAELGVRIAILQDLQGPKIRIGKLVNSPITLRRDEKVVIGIDSEPGTPERLSTTYTGLPTDAQPGDRILMSDGLVELRVDEVHEHEVNCTIVRGGLVSERSGLNLPGVQVSAPALTEKDIKDLAFGIERGVDYLAVSFIRKPEDVQGVKDRIKALGADTPVIAKLEKPEAITNLDGILKVADGVMVARGDLGVEVSVEKVPVLQKTIISKANERGIPVITATQMLETMVRNQTPTRAEASDVANAILDGTDAVMLSAETAIGDYPFDAVATMGRIAEEAESSPESFRIIVRPVPPPGSLPHAIAAAADITARQVGAKALVAFTRSGYTAQLMSKFRLKVPLIAVTPSETVARRMALYWGVVSEVVDGPAGLDGLLDTVEAGARNSKLVHSGDTVVITTSTQTLTPSGVATNLLEIVRL